MTRKKTEREKARIGMSPGGERGGYMKSENCKDAEEDGKMSARDETERERDRARIA